MTIDCPHKLIVAAPYLLQHRNGECDSCHAPFAIEMAGGIYIGATEDPVFHIFHLVIPIRCGSCGVWVTQIRQLCSNPLNVTDEFQSMTKKEI